MTHPIVVQCPTCFKLEDYNGTWKKLKSVNFLLPFQYLKACPECLLQTQKVRVECGKG